MIKKRVVIFIGMVLLASTVSSVNAEVFNRVGKVRRTLSAGSGSGYGGCMVNLSTVIGNGCPNNGWVSLDCDDLYSTNKGVGGRGYASAVIAAAMGKTVTVRVNTDKKHGNYCVAERLDIVFF
jgi:hypothetical protein